MSTTTEIVMGYDLKKDGYLTDTSSRELEVWKKYNVEFIRYTEVTCIWRVGLRKPERK